MIALAKYLIKNKLFKAQPLLGFLLLFTGCDKDSSVIHYQGETMGTTYSIKIIHDNNKIINSSLKIKIDSLLAKINKQMSTWDPNSEVSSFNKWNSLEPYKISKSVMNVVKNSMIISEKTDGLFDITVFDLMSLWGFGPHPKTGPPKYEEINMILSFTGYKKVRSENGRLIKTNPNLKIDLNAIAKGYGVDEVFKFLRTNGHNNIFVEIGGEVRCSGNNKNNQDWSIGLENPTGYDINQKKFSAILHPKHYGIATSGNYRNIVDMDGEILGHTINPKTGYPIQTDVLSVTVLAPSTMLADGWATALMVMDYASGSKLVDENSEIMAIWILGNGKDKRSIALSDGVDIMNPIYNIKK